MSKDTEKLNNNDSASEKSAIRRHIRIPPELFKKLKLLADKNRRVVGSEIICLLEQAIENNKN